MKNPVTQHSMKHLMNDLKEFPTTDIPVLDDFHRINCIPLMEDSLEGRPPLSTEVVTTKTLPEMIEGRLKKEKSV